MCNDMRKATGEDNRDLVREKEEADRQYLIEEVTQELSNTLYHTMLSTCASAREKINLINLIYQCLNNSCAILKSI